MENLFKKLPRKYLHNRSVQWLYGTLDTRTNKISHSTLDKKLTPNFNFLAAYFYNFSKKSSCQSFFLELKLNPFSSLMIIRYTRPPHQANITLDMFRTTSILHIALAKSVFTWEASKICSVQQTRSTAWFLQIIAALHLSSVISVWETYIRCSQFFMKATLDIQL